MNKFIHMYINSYIFFLGTLLTLKNEMEYVLVWVCVGGYPPECWGVCICSSAAAHVRHYFSWMCKHAQTDTRVSHYNN